MHQLALFLQTQPSAEEIQRIVLAVIPIMGFFILIGLAAVVVPFWFICKKAGFSPWLTFLNVIPAGNLILIYVLAFAEWKVIPVPQAVWQIPQPVPPQPQPPSAGPKL